MYIKSATVNNFKCFGNSDNKISFKIPDNSTRGIGLIIFVGKNNSGKSSLFEAIDFVRNGPPRTKGIQNIKNQNAGKDEKVFVDIEFTDNITSIIDSFAQENKIDTIKKFIYDESGHETFLIRRSSEDPKEILLFNKPTGEYINKVGISAPIQKLFEANFIWADSNPNDEAKFGSTTICGKLLKEISSTFTKTPEYMNLSKAFDEAFNKKGSSLKKALEDIEKRTQKIFETQFGKASITFHFDDPEVDNYFKNVRIRINENDGQETNLEDKGSGMQRAVALALLQVYVEVLVKHPDKEISKPLFLFIDEPEVCLHPQAQQKLLNALLELSKTRQVFITTHSPYFVEPSLFKNIYHLVNNGKSIQRYTLTDQALLQNIHNNRTLLFQHREIFFTETAIFLEGMCDIERYSKFCYQNGFKDLPSFFFYMNGNGQVEFYEKLCAAYGIQNFYAIVDSDYAFTVPYWARKKGKHCQTAVDRLVDEAKLTWFNKQKFNESITKNLSVHTKTATKILDSINVNGIHFNKIKDKNIIVLQGGEVTDYLDEKGQDISGNSDSHNELIAIFSHINNGIS